jgi:ubiquinone/menaquinone biosynthesis C-methylase UbiE
MVAHAWRVMSSVPNASFQVLSGSSLRPQPGESVDVVYCTGVFMHLDEWDRYSYVEEAFRVLRPGGRLYVDNINLLGSEGWERFQELRRLPVANRPPQISKTSTPEELRTYLERAGFCGIQVSSEALWVSARGQKLNTPSERSARREGERPVRPPTATEC